MLFCLQRVHDLCLVRPSEIQGISRRLVIMGELGLAFFEYWLAVRPTAWAALSIRGTLKTMQE